jgi:putative hydroxymethylpyrimidine transport system permease protein
MKALAHGLIIFISLLLLWQACVTVFALPPYILPSPWQVITVSYMRADLIAHEAIPTIFETLVGLAMGIILGALAAIMMVFIRPVSYWLLPILIISQAIPTFAIAPLLVIWLGYGMASKIATTVIMLFFPITSALYDGLRRTPQNYLDVAQTLQAKPWRIFWHIKLPAALPSFASGIRVATVIAPIGAVVGEWVGASQGLGFLMLNANARMQIDLMFAALFTLVIFSLLLYYSVNTLLTRCITW